MNQTQTDRLAFLRKEKETRELTGPEQQEVKDLEKIEAKGNPQTNP